MNFEFIVCATSNIYEKIVGSSVHKDRVVNEPKLAYVEDDDEFSISSETVYSDEDSFLDDEESSLVDEEEWSRRSSSSCESSSCLAQQFAQLSLDELEECLLRMQDKVGKQHPLTAQMWDELGLRYFDNEDLPAAIDCFRHAILACPTCNIQIAHAYYHLGRCYAAHWDTRRQAFDLFLLAAESYEFLAAYDAQDRTYELSLIDAEVTQLLQQKD